MENPLQAVELIGTIDEKGQLHLDAPISEVGHFALFYSRKKLKSEKMSG